MNVRPSVETWNRGELEDKFYRQYDQLIALKKKNNELEKRLRLSSSRIRQVLQNGESAETDERIRELERENRLLIQKLKALRHQLINYTRPQAHNTTLNFLTSRSTARPPSSQEDPTRVTGPKVNGYHSDGPEVVHRPEIVISRPAKSGPQSDRAINSEEKATIIRLHRENREKSEEIEDLQFQLSKNDEKLQNLRLEYDKLLAKFEESQRRINEFSDPESGYPSDNGTAAIVEKELIILREENRVLKAANDRFVSNSLTQEESAKSATKELQTLQKNIQETELKLAEITAENKQMNKRIKEMESEKKYTESKYKKLKEKLSNREIQRAKPFEEITEAVLSPVAESPLPKVELKREKRRRSKAVEPSVLDRLFEDVASIVESHISRTDSSLSLDHEPATNAKWRQLYEQVYSELEKVRNLLLIQHRINERQKKEISILNEYNDHNKQEYERKLAEFVTELNRRAKRIEILENQLRSIASGATDFDHSVLTDSKNLKKIELTSVSTTDMTLRLTKLRITEAGLKIVGSPEATVFISLEFFDFELQTTPLIQGPEAVFDYSTVYEVIVSNLFIHYIEKEGITIEIFEVRGINYEQIGFGVISLKKLLETETPARITGQLKINSASGDRQTILAVLEYSLEVPFSLMKALKAQKRKLTASTYLPTGVEDKSLYNELIIQIHRCSNLDSLCSDSKYLPSTFVVYQIYDLQPHLTTVVSKNVNPVFDDTRSFMLPRGSALHKYLKTEELVIHVIEESKSSPGIQKELGHVKLPLFVLARNQKLQGSFPLTSEDGSLSKATIDVSLHWKYAYTFNDENLEVEAPIPVKFPKLVKPQKEPSIQEEETSVESLPEPMVKQPEPKVEPQPEPSVIPSGSVSSDGSVEGSTIIEVPPIVPKSFPLPSAAFKNSDSSSDDTYVVDDEDLDTDLQQRVREMSIDSNNESTEKEEDEKKEPPEKFVEEKPSRQLESSSPEVVEEKPLPSRQPKPESSSTEEESGNGVKEPQRLQISTSSSDFSQSEIEEIKNLKGLKEELEKLDKEDTDASDEFALEEEKEEIPTPPLKLPPIPPPRRLSKTKAVDFTEPLHSSIPPSEESSFAGSVDGTPRPRETKIIQKSSPNISAPASTPAIRQSSAGVQIEGNHLPESDYLVTIRLGRLSVVEHSPLLSDEYDHINVFIEWNFLDFANELCETPESVPIPRNTWKVETFECERVYELNSRRVALLKQWIETQSRLNFNLVSDPEEDDGCDDLGVAQLDLSDVINSSIHSIAFHDVNGEAIAVLDLTMLYSDELTKLLTGERN